MLSGRLHSSHWSHCSAISGSGFAAPFFYGFLCPFVVQLLSCRVHWAPIITKMIFVNVISFVELSTEIAHVYFANAAYDVIAVVVIFDKRGSASWALANDCTRSNFTLAHLCFL
jgi:hypothetical protein